MGADWALFPAFALFTALIQFRLESRFDGASHPSNWLARRIHVSHKIDSTRA